MPMPAYEAGDGTPIVLLHGFGLDHRSLLPLDPVIERAGGWHRLYFDLLDAPGSADLRSAQDVADHVVRRIRERIGNRPFAVLGASFGGMIARHVAHESREQVLGVATVAGVFVPDRATRTVPPRTVLHREPAIEPLLGDALEQYREDAVVESVADARDFLRYLRPGLRDVDPAVLERIASRYFLDRDPEEAFPTPFNRPTLHITGRQDDIVGYRDAWNRVEHYPRASFAVLDGAGHNLLFEQADVCAALITDWLERVRRAT